MDMLRDDRGRYETLALDRDLGAGGWVVWVVVSEGRLNSRSWRAYPVGLGKASNRCAGSRVWMNFQPLDQRPWR